MPILGEDEWGPLNAHAKALASGCQACACQPACPTGAIASGAAVEPASGDDPEIGGFLRKASLGHLLPTLVPACRNEPAPTCAQARPRRSTAHACVQVSRATAPTVRR